MLSNLLGGQVYKCNSCSHYHYSFHSCGNRSCNNCQNNNADDWLANNNNLLLPVNYFMVTFTLPEELRLTKCTFLQSSRHCHPFVSTARQEPLIHSPRILNISAVSQVPWDSAYWSSSEGMDYQKLSFHPHIHYLITGGGISINDKKWISSHSNKFLFPVKALSIVFKAKFRDELRKLNPLLFNQIAPQHGLRIGLLTQSRLVMDAML